MAKFTLSVDDACSSDVRVAELATKYKIDTVFYWPVEWHSLAFDKGYEPLTYEQALAIASKHEIGAHTITHRHLTKLPQHHAVREIFDSKIMLQNLLKTKITKFCAPRGYTNEELTKWTLKLYKSQRLTRGEGLVHIHPNSGANNNIHWIEYANSIDVKELWGHSHEFDKYNLWEELEVYLRENTHSK